MHLPHYKLLRDLAKFEERATLSLASSECEPLTVEELLGLERGAERKFKELQLTYSHVQGREALRKAISKEYMLINPDQILVTAGSEEAIFLSLSTLLKKGDHLIVQTPCYQPYYEIPRALGCEISFWEANEEEGWELEIKNLAKMVQKNTRLILMSAPSHPTGYLLASKQLFDIIEFARENRLVLFCDESYSGLEHFPQERLPKVADLYEKGISLGVLSKAYALPGLRVGWIATKDKVLLHEMMALKDYTTMSTSAPSEFLAELALKHNEAILERNRGLIHAHLPLLKEFFKNYKTYFDCKMPRAGCLAFARLKRGSAGEFCADLLEKEELMCIPSTLFDFGDQHIRIGFGRKNFARALQQLEKYLNTQVTRKAS